MSCASCESPFSNYLIAARDMYGSLSASVSSTDRINPITRIQLVGQTIKQMVPIVIYGVKATNVENKNVNVEVSDTGIRYVPNGQDQMVYDASAGPYAGLRPRDLNAKTARLNPDLYNPEDLKTDIVTEASFRAGATDVITIYPRKGDDHRNINVYRKDKNTGVISLTTINASTDGNNKTYDQILKIAKEQFPDLNLISPEDPSGPTDHVFVLSNVKVTQDKIEEVMKELGTREETLEIKEEKMRIDKEKGKVYLKNKEGKEVDIESHVLTELELKQKHRLVGRIKSCHNCALKTGKTEGFFYAPKSLDDAKKDRTISQVLVDMQGNVVFKTINLSAYLSDSDLKQLLLKLGEPGKSLPVREFTYTDDPISDVKMKEIVKNGLAEISARNRFEFLTLRVFPIENRFDFLRERLGTDRIVANNPVMYFHDIALSQGAMKIENVPKQKEQAAFIYKDLDFAQTSLNALVVFAEGVYGADRMIGDSVDVDKKAERDIPEENENNILILNQEVELYGKIHRKKRVAHQGSSDDNGGKPPPTADFYVDNSKSEKSVRHLNQRSENSNPKDPKPQSPTKMYLEEENSSLFQEYGQERYLVRDGMIIKQTEETQETVIKINEQTSEMLIENTQDYHYYDLNHDSEQVQNNVENIKLLNMKSNDLRRLIFPVITRSLPIGERVDLNEKYQAQMDQIWEMFLNLYFGIQFGDARKEVKSSKSSLKFVAEQEVRSPINFFTQTQFLPYMRVFAILLICILKLSTNI